MELRILHVPVVVQSEDGVAARLEGSPPGLVGLFVCAVSGCHAAPAVAATAATVAAIRACVPCIGPSQMDALGGLGFDARD
jgi:hypothetical protein